MSLANIPSPSDGVWNLGPLPLRAYALAIILGIVVAIWVGERRFVARGGRPGTVSDVAVWAIPFGLVGARAYHVATNPEFYFGDGKDPVQALYVWEGGLGIWGAIAFGALGAYLGCRFSGVRFTSYIDAVAPGIVLAQAIGRWGNYFNQELFGEPTDRPWGLEIDLDNRPEGYLEYSTFHPTFLYESLWCLGVALVVVLADRRFRLGRGRVFALYVALYTAGRAWIEDLRIDDAHEFGPFRLNVWVSAGIFVLAVAYFVIVGRLRPGREESVLRDGAAATAEGEAGKAEDSEAETAGAAATAQKADAEKSEAEKVRAGAAVAAEKTGSEKAAEESESEKAGAAVAAGKAESEESESEQAEDSETERAGAAMAADKADAEKADAEKAESERADAEKAESKKAESEKAEVSETEKDGAAVTADDKKVDVDADEEASDEATTEPDTAAEAADDAKDDAAAVDAEKPATSDAAVESSDDTDETAETAESDADPSETAGTAAKAADDADATADTAESEAAAEDTAGSDEDSAPDAAAPAAEADQETAETDTDAESDSAAETSEPADTAAEDGSQSEKTDEDADKVAAAKRWRWRS